MNYAVLFDLNATRADFSSFEDALTRLDGRIAYCKFYSYNQKRNNDFSAYIKAHGAEVAVPLYNRKKVRIDMRQVVDAIFLACSNPTIDAFFIVCAPIDCQPMINMLKTLGKGVYIGGESGSDIGHMCDGYIVLRKGLSLDNIASPKSVPADRAAGKTAGVNSHVNGDYDSVGKTGAVGYKDGSNRTVGAKAVDYGDGVDRCAPHDTINSADDADMRYKADGAASYRADDGVTDNVRYAKRASTFDSAAKWNADRNGYTDKRASIMDNKPGSIGRGNQSAPYANDAYYADSVIVARPMSANSDISDRDSGRVSIAQRSEIAARGDDAMLRSLKSESFLPFTDIEDCGGENMAAVRKKLSDIIAGKASAKESDIPPSQAELDMLLKKYF